MTRKEMYKLIDQFFTDEDFGNFDDTDEDTEE